MKLITVKVIALMTTINDNIKFAYIFLKITDCQSFPKDKELKIIVVAFI